MRFMIFNLFYAKTFRGTPLARTMGGKGVCSWGGGGPGKRAGVWGGGEGGGKGVGGGGAKGGGGRAEGRQGRGQGRRGQGAGGGAGSVILRSESLQS